MTISPEMILAENVAARLRRGIVGSDLSYGQLIAIAQQAIGPYQQKSYFDHAANLYQEENAHELIAVARILDLLATYWMNNAAPTWSRPLQKAAR